MGLGLALMEETYFDERNGRVMNPSLAEYHVRVHMDVPEIDVIWIDIPDPHAPIGGTRGWRDRHYGRRSGGCKRCLQRHRETRARPTHYAGQDVVGALSSSTTSVAVAVKSIAPNASKSLMH